MPYEFQMYEVRVGLGRSKTKRDEIEPDLNRLGKEGWQVVAALNHHTGLTYGLVLLDARERHRSSSRTPGHAAPTRAYESRHNVDDSRCAPPAERQTRKPR